MTTRSPSQNERILAVLADGREHSMHEIHARAGFMRLNSRISELRTRGHQIECRRDGNDYFYRLVSLAQPDLGSPHTLTPPLAHRGAGGTGSGHASEREPDANRVAGVSTPAPAGTLVAASAAPTGEQSSRPLDSPLQLELGVAA